MCHHTIQDVPDCSIRTLPHGFEVEFFNPGFICINITLQKKKIRRNQDRVFYNAVANGVAGHSKDETK